MQVERVDRVELEQVHQEHAHLFSYLDVDGVFLIVERNGVDGVKVVLVIKVDVDTIHHHHKLVVHRRPTVLWIDDERSIQPLGNMPGQRKDVTVVQVQTERLGVELVGKALARANDAGPPAPGTPSIS